ncbi:YraN family protein [Alteromonas flava]|uniref:YraN family protein n=1 Tax=Alteromonas flava TaxID=2048003 RepID=UPI000C285531|nr:YraN family protein [Alteromonas flava]
MPAQGNQNKAIGDNAESRALAYLLKQGLAFVTRNYRCKCGEIDLIFREQATWVFVEVKFRSAHKYGYPVEQLSAMKLRRVVNAVRVFLMDNHLNEYDTAIRIDLIALDESSIQWIKNVTG